MQPAVATLPADQSCLENGNTTVISLYVTKQAYSSKLLFGLLTTVEESNITTAALPTSPCVWVGGMQPSK